MARLRMVPVDIALLDKILRQGYINLTLRVLGIPQDAQFRGAYLGVPTIGKNQILMIYEHESFDEVKESDIIPSMTVVHEVVNTKPIFSMN